MLKNPNQKISYNELEHELQHLKKREQVSNVVMVAGVVLGMISLGGIIGGGAFILGALLAIAFFAASYSYCCRLAESSLRGLAGSITPSIAEEDQAVNKATGSLFGFFSQ